MGFGISDEAMERIRDSIWNCSAGSVDHFDTSRVPSYRPMHGRAAAAKLYFPHARTKAASAHASLTRQDIFLASAYYAVVYLIREDKLKSEIISDWVEHLTEYYLKLFTILELEPRDVLTAAKIKYDKNAGNFLMQSIFDSMLRLFDSPSFSKPSFRDAVDDIFYLARSWGIASLNIKNRSDFFFSYVKNTYGLNQSNFFCCQFCGEPLINGIAFCPNCFENSRDSVTLRYRPVKLSDRSSASASLPQKTGDAVSENTAAQQLKAAEEEKWELSKRLDELVAVGNEKEQGFNVKIEELEATVKELKQHLAERDRLISSLYRQKEYDLPPSTQYKKRILIFGASMIPQEDLLSLADEVGLTDVDFEFQTEYVKLRQYSARIKKNSSSYAGIILGPAPHKIKEDIGAESPTAYFKSSDFFVVEAKTYNGELKITKESARMAFSTMYNHLLAAGFYTN